MFISVKTTETIRVNVVKEAPIPYWMELAMKGEKINAIKELRVVGGVGPDGRFISLVHAKNVVETFMGTIKTTRS